MIKVSILMDKVGVLWNGPSFGPKFFALVIYSHECGIVINRFFFFLMIFIFDNIVCVVSWDSCFRSRIIFEGFYISSPR